jgi:CRP-like cAMP-binding protein
MNTSVFRQQKDTCYRHTIASRSVKGGSSLLRLVDLGYSIPQAVASQVQTFEPGGDILDYKIADWARPQPVATGRQADAYFVVQGRVRIIGQSQQRTLPYSAALLHPGELFGVDHLFVADPLSYRAVAATTCQVVRVPYSDLSFWIDQQPMLGTYWSYCLEWRVKQLFFKRFTPLQALPSNVLTSRLLPQIQELRVAADITLGEAIKPYAGYFWLRSGDLISQSASSHPLSIGHGWSGSHRYLADAVAQTPLRLFHLPSRVWEASNLSPLMHQFMSVS